MKKLEEGFTTGSCAAACALASCLWRARGECPERVEVLVPGGRWYQPEIHPLGRFCCGVYKEAGDDPDITDGAEVWAQAEPLGADGPVRFCGGEGVGTVTRPGLKLPVGEPAINPVPRRMIEEAVRQVFPREAVRVTVGITNGRELARKTFNPRLGIEGGLSVLGTTGIVRPMSEDALMDSIRLELEQKRAEKVREVGLVFGSQGEEALLALRPGLPCVQISNYVGFAMEACLELGYSRVLLAGQPGKLVKVAGGCMQTHSRWGDGRRETLCAHLALMGAPRALLETVMDSVTLEGLVPEIKEAGYSGVWNVLCRRAGGYCMARTRGELKVDTLMFDRDGTLLGAFEGGES